MTAIIIIIIAVGILIYYSTKNKSKQTHNNTPSNTINQTNIPQQKFQSQLSTLPFPDRTDAILWHINAINKSLSSNNLELANLSYAKLIESIRQQNFNEKGKYEQQLQTIQKEYDQFRTYYKLEYPEEFLPPTERKKKQNTPPTIDKNNTPVYLETLNYGELPKSVLKHIDIVRTISQWNELGLKPKQDTYGNWNDIKRQERYFLFTEATETNPRYKLSLETGKRITSKPYYIKALVEQGIPLNEFIDNGEDLERFIKADDLFEEEKYEEALKEIQIALTIRKNTDYEELKKDIQIKLGNQDIIEQQFKEYEYDIDSPIHTGEIYDWLKVLLKNKRIDKVIHYIQKTNDTLDKLSKQKIKPKIYGEQSGDWYSYKKEDFNKNLFRILDFSQLEQTDDAVKMLDIIINLYTDKSINPIENIADTYAQWKLNDKALPLYEVCLEKLIGEEKPRVKSRLAKKIDNLKNTP